jgi:hypothetical protein
MSSGQATSNDINKIEQASAANQGRLKASDATANGEYFCFFIANFPAVSGRRPTINHRNCSSN